MFDLGDTWALTALVYDDDGALANADTVTLTITLPDGTTTSPTVTNPPTTTGTYVYDYVPVQTGRHTARWVFAFSGGSSASYQDAVHVDPAPAAAILSLADAKAHLNITTTTHDDELRGWIASTTEVIEHHVGPVVRGTYTQRVNDGPTLWLHHRPVIAVTSITPVHTSGTTYSTSGVVVDTVTGRVDLADGSCFTGGPWTVTYTAGRPVIPPNVQHAARIILKHLWETQRGSDGRRPIPGGQDDTFTPGFAYSIPRRALELLEPQRRGPMVG